MMAVLNLFHHIVGNLFFVGAVACIILAITTIAGVIVLLAGPISGTSARKSHPLSQQANSRR
jgi:hypothetical protein